MAIAERTDPKGFAELAAALDNLLPMPNMPSESFEKIRDRLRVAFLLGYPSYFDAMLKKFLTAMGILYPAGVFQKDRVAEASSGRKPDPDSMFALALRKNEISISKIGDAVYPTPSEAIIKNGTRQNTVNKASAALKRAEERVRLLNSENPTEVYLALNREIRLIHSTAETNELPILTGSSQQQEAQGSISVKHLLNIGNRIRLARERNAFIRKDLISKGEDEDLPLWERDLDNDNDVAASAESQLTPEPS